MALNGAQGADNEDLAGEKVSHGHQGPCYLLELPAELRNEIYSLALYHPNGITIDCVSHRQLTPHLLALTATCKQIKNECAHFIFTQNCLRLKIHQHPGGFTRFVVFRNFCYETIIEARLGSKFGEFRIDTGFHGVAEFDIKAKILYSWVRWALDLCRQRTNNVRWCFEMHVGGVEVAYSISMRSRESALESLQSSKKSAHDTGDTLVQEDHSNIERAVTAYFMHCENEGPKY
jgi:hypothetical protein